MLDLSSRSGNSPFLPRVLQIVLVSLLRFLIQGFDENGNDILDGQETVNWFEEFKQMIGTSPELDAVMKRDWMDSEMNGDTETATKAEIVQFLLRFLNSIFSSRENQ